MKADENFEIGLQKLQKVKDETSATWTAT